MKRDSRFPVVMSQAERALLNCLAQRERIPAAAVVRRLIWREAQRFGLLLPEQYGASRPDQPAGEVVR